ncbi:MAG: hypothetical protein IKS41_01855, partial [Alphaproteobacteria bacterium]|nr:hypothetical protein [Alphaproteobacteria bacterium]
MVVDEVIEDEELLLELGLMDDVVLELDELMVELLDELEEDELLDDVVVVVVVDEVVEDEELLLEDELLLELGLTDDVVDELIELNTDEFIEGFMELEDELLSCFLLPPPPPPPPAAKAMPPPTTTAAATP